MKTCTARIYTVTGGCVCITVSYRGVSLFHVTDKEALQAGMTRDQLARRVAAERGYTHMRQINDANGYHALVSLI